MSFQPPGPGDQQPVQPPDSNPQPPATSSRVVERVVALLEVLLCSGLPTQHAIGGTFLALGVPAYDRGGALSIRYVVGVSLIDAVVVIGLVVLFLRVHGERPREVVAGDRPIVSEAIAGVPMTFAALAIAVGVIALTRVALPWLHTVEHNPMQDMLRTPRDAWVFALVVIVAGGVREEIQRAFILHRFKTSLGGGTTGVIVTSLAFGVGHSIQGADAALATGLLGAYWGVIYLRRRSAIAPMVSHAGFDVLQIIGFVAARNAALPA